MKRALLLFLVFLPASVAASGSVSDELGFGAGQADPHSPRTGEVTNTITGSVDLGKEWSLYLSTGLTLLQPTKGVPGAQFGSAGTTTVYFSPGATWRPDDHLTFGLAVTYSPRSELRADTVISYSPAPGQTANADALVSAVTTSRAARGLISYDTAGFSSWETSIDLDGGVDHYDAEQRIISARDPNGNALGPAQLKAEAQSFCKTRACTRQVIGLFREHATPLEQGTVRLRVTETIYRDTDVGMAGSYFMYDRDPTSVGYFGLVAPGRGATFWSGIPLAPLQWSARPELTHRFGDLSARLWLEHGAYVDSEGTMDVLGAKLLYRFTRRFRMWITASVQRDKDAENNVTRFVQAALGVMLSM